MAFPRDNENAINPGHSRIRIGLRISGVLVLVSGLIIFGIGLFDFLSAFDEFGQPQRPWLLFVGLVLIPIGFALCAWGFMGAMLRYQAQETTPVGVDAINYAGPRMRPAVRSIASAISRGLAEGGRGRSVDCPSCGASNDRSAKYCDQCGASFEKKCASCGHQNEADAKFCSGCSKELTSAD